MPSSRNLEFSSDAEDDIRSILQSTREQWGDTVRRQYADRLDASLLRILDHPMLGRPRGDYGPDLRSLRSGEHIIYYRPTESGIMVRRVLHHRHDTSPEDFS